MKRIVIIFSFIFCGSYLQAQNVNFEWAKHIDSDLESFGRSTVLDAVGNVYITGWYNGTTDFDPGLGVFTLTSPSTNVFILKLDPLGNFLWVRNFAGTAQENGYSIALDNARNIYATGSFEGTCDFDPGAGVFNLTSAGLADIFVLKLDANGNFTWAKQIGANVNDISMSIALDQNADPYLTGRFSNVVDFDPGPGIYNIIPTGYTDIFVCKLNTNGNFVWAKHVGASLDQCEGSSLTTDGAGSVLVTGSFNATADFDPGPGLFNLTSFGATDIFILKLDMNGNFIWAKQLGGFSSQEGFSVKADIAGNIYTTGFFGAVADFDPGPGVYNLGSVSSDANIFISKLDINGNFVWARAMGGNLDDYGRSIWVDAAGNVYSTGNFNGTADFDPGPGIYNMTAIGSSNAFISKLDNSGNFAWARQFEGTGASLNYSISISNTASIYTTGFFVGTVDFDPGPGVYVLTNGVAGYGNLFVNKLSQCANTSAYIFSAAACSEYTLNGQTYTATGVYTQTLVNAAGCDSIITLNLSINNRYTAFSVAACGSYTWNGKTYLNTGTYKDTLTTTTGCDSIITLNLVINPVSLSTIGAVICSGQSYEGYTVTGTYIDTFVAANGCDSIRTLNLTVKPGSFSIIDTAICSGQNYAGHTTSGTYNDIFIAANGCDSVRTLNLTVKNNCGIYIPNSFTPNRDGLNDLFKPTINLAFQKFSFIIFSRYGEKIFETHEYGKGWDGTYKGKEQVSGTYVYRITFTNNFGYESEYNGTVLLIR